jgi:predicted Rdx family selenoprotein
MFPNVEICHVWSAIHMFLCLRTILTIPLCFCCFYQYDFHSYTGWPLSGYIAPMMYDFHKFTTNYCYSFFTYSTNHQILLGWSWMIQKITNVFAPEVYPALSPSQSVSFKIDFSMNKKNKNLDDFSWGPRMVQKKCFSYKVVPPSDVNWSINPINYSYIYYKP